MRTHLEVRQSPINPATVDVISECPGCGRRTTLFGLSRAALKAWERGELIQKVFPELSAEEREKLVTGYCGVCWEELFGEPEQDEPEPPAEPDWDEVRERREI